MPAAPSCAETALAPGFHPVPSGHVATVVTHLEMRAPPGPAPAPPQGVALGRWAEPEPERYRALFRRVGAPWLWFSRLILDDADLAAILSDRGTEVYSVTRDGAEIGLAELDFRQEGACELTFLGLVPEATGGGIGRWLLAEVATLAWTRPISRFHVHTCTLDSPRALPAYRRAGFVPVRQEVEIAPDPRVTGALPADAAPQIPQL
ncbi:GNAT family N-acetyltransferase [Rhodobacteraceae bacterium CCMM004]|nr:GNAT family N-acetyltransferase [Rhodobacteraceae bacterium CCMM004]